MSLLVKVCGLKTPETLDAALDAGADFVGFVFFPPSPRNLAFDAAPALGERVRGRAKKVALTVDADDTFFERIVEALKPDMLQLHGHEAPERVADLKKRYGLPVMKALPIETRSDLAAIEGIVAAAYAKYVTRIGRRPAPMDADYAALLEATEVHVCERGGEIVGMLVLAFEPDHVLIENVAVRPDRQGEGIGRALLACAEAEARSREIHRLRLYTNEKMTENIAMYGRLGYREVAREQQAGFARVFMEKKS